MNDPREVVQTDPFGELTSDEEDQRELEDQIVEIERQKRDLVERLKLKRQLKSKDPNFDAIQVESSPVKKPAEPIKVEPSRTKRVLNIENLNEKKIESRSQIPANTTSYFIDNFRNSKKEEQKSQQERQELLSKRVHTFRGIDGNRKFKAVSVEEVEEYSDLWVKQRYISQDDLRKVLHEVKILRLSKLFAKIKPPKFTEPQYSNWAAIGIISAKGQVKFSSSGKPMKYFKFTLTDFQYNLDVYVFGKKGVERYYNLRVGDIIAILNPEVLPWRPSEKGNFIKSFNLRISHDFPCILEIGQSRDIDWCKSFNKSQNKACGTPINKTKEKCCDFHREIQFRSNHAKRIELNGSFALGAPTKVDSGPALYREKSTGAHRNFKVLPNHYQKSVGKNSDLRGIHFSNGNAAKAFFNDEFQNPDILNNLDSKRRKRQDDKKSLILQQQLKRINSRHAAIEIEKGSEKYEEICETTEATLQSGLIQNLGFDPTNGEIGNVLKQAAKDKFNNGQLNKKQKEVSSLLKFKKEHVELKPAKEVLLQRKRDRERAWQENFGDKSVDLSADSDSDIEIV